MSTTSRDDPPGFDADFDLARRAVEAGLLTEQQVEAAMLEQEKSTGRRLAEFLPIAPEALRDLRPPSARALPAEVAAAMKAPANRCGAYWILAKLGEGGMGEVFRAWDGRLGRWVALKLPKKFESGEARARFLREAGMAAGLDHPNIAKVFEVGEADGRPFLAMQYIDGRTLEAAARGAGRERVLEWVRQAARGIGAAHAAGIIHRDLKPTNVMIDAQGHAYVLDFGLAKATDVGDSIPGGSRIVAGTPNFMSPEQAQGRSDARSDIYGIGAVLYDTVTGRPPFVGETTAEILLQVVDREPLAPRKLDPGASRDCEAIILKCLEKDPARRYPDVPALLEDLDACLKREPLRHARRRTPLYVLEKKIRRHPVPWFLGALAVALLITGGAFAIAWTLSPGTLRMKISPSGATVRIDGRAWVAGEGPLVIDLAAGVKELRIDAPGHESQVIPVLVRRRAAQDIRVDLKHDQGVLDATAAPADAAIKVDGTDYGARLHRLPLDTGRHELEVSAPGSFDARRTVEILRGETARADFALDNGELWRMSDEAIQSGCRVVSLPDLDRDGADDIAMEELTAVVILSGASGKVLRRETVSDTPQWNLELMDLGGMKALTCRSDSASGLGVIFLGLSDGWETRKTVVWKEPGATRQGARAARIDPCEDLDGDGVREVIAGGRGGKLWILNAVTGQAGPSVELGDPKLSIQVVRACGAIAVFAGTTHEGELEPGPHLLGAVSLAQQNRRWFRAGSFEQVSPVVVDKSGLPCLLAATSDAWELIDGITGATRFRIPLPAANLLPWAVDLDGDGLCDLLCGISEKRFAALNPSDGKALWELPDGGWLDHCVGPGRSLLLLSPEGIRCVNVADGHTRWRVKGTFAKVLAGDLDRDGSPEVLAGGAGDGLRCLSADGKPAWTLRLKGSPLPLALLGTGEESRIVFARGSSFIGVARTPRVLWRATAMGPLLAPPVVARLRDGRQVVVQNGDWGEAASLRAFDACTGDVLWSAARSSPPNFPAAVADLDRDGEDEVVAWMQSALRDSMELQILAARDGAAGRHCSAPPYTDGYSVPVVADLDGDGVPDLAVNRRLASDEVAFSGKTGAVLWRRDLGGQSWGGAACADLDGDGHPDLVAPADGQPLRALRGTNGAVLWERASGSGSRRAPVLAPLNDDATADVVAVTDDGELLGLDGRSGSVIFSLKCDGHGAPTIASTSPGHALILVPRGERGLTAFTWPGLSSAWSLTAEVEAAAATGDLDADGRPEVVVATLSGAVEVLDLETGRRLWSHALPDAGCLATPVLRDLDADGVLDILVADRAGTLRAISGRPTCASRR
ncbi:MAG: FG-GAP-like repeat-containing protein [Planctomycetota bacterium]